MLVGDDMNFGEKLQLLRKNNGISQEELSNLVNINRNCISRIETGKSDASITQAKDISDFFGVDIKSMIYSKEQGLSNTEKIKIISENCKYLNEDDLNLIIRMISVLRKEYVKNNLK